MRETENKWEGEQVRRRDEEVGRERGEVSVAASLDCSMEVQVVDQGNIVEFMVAGERFHGAEIRRKAKAFIQDNLAWLKQQEGWKARFRGQAELILELL